MKTSGSKLEAEVIEKLKTQVPVRGLPGIRIRDVKRPPKDGFDVTFRFESGDRSVVICGEIKPAVSPKLLEQLAPWIRRMRSLRPDATFALICPLLTPRSQDFCIENGINFLDLAGNISIDLPGTLTVKRLGMRGDAKGIEGTRPPSTNVFSGRSSRILRVLLEQPYPRTLTEIATEIERETNRFAAQFPNSQLAFTVSLGAISKALSSLEEQLWIRRRDSAVVVPEPRRLLLEWAEKYKERYRWRLRSSFESSNSYGASPATIATALESLLSTPFAFTGAAAAADAPFVDIDRIDIFLPPSQMDSKLRQTLDRPALPDTPRIRFIYAYDEGVFMYLNRQSRFPRVSNIQAYLDLYARGGRDLKQADVLLERSIAPRWNVS